MPVVLEKYGPVLDPTIEVVKELVTHGSADLHVPEHPEALGMAVDMQLLLYRLYNFMDIELYLPSRFPVLIIGKEKPNVERLLIRVRIDRDGFEIPEQESFSGYSHITILDLADKETEKIQYGSKVSISANSSPQNFVPQENPLLDFLLMNGYTLPPNRKKIKLDINYHGVNKFPIGMRFQGFYPLERFTKKMSGKEGYHYPVSSKNRHELSYRSWQFFEEPAYWDSWSHYAVMALDRLAGIRTYTEAAKYYSADVKKTIEHASKAERPVIRLLRAMTIGEDISHLADDMKCPRAYMSIYFEKILGSLDWLFNPDSLRDIRKRGYLENLVRNCRIYGFNVTPEILVASVTSYRRQQTL